MTWQPNAQVTVAGTDYTASALIGASITYGRTTTYGQPRPGYANLTLADTTNSELTFQIGDPLVITIEDTDGDPVPVFTGTLTEITTTAVAAGPGGTYIKRDLIGIGPLSLLNRELAGGGGYPVQNDGDRMVAILQEVYGTTWAGEDAALTWGTEPAGLTWAEYDPIIGDIDTPGLYELADYTSGAANGYTLAGQAAVSGLGVLYDTPGGAINYDDADHRQTNALTNGYWQIPLAAIEGAGLAQSVSLSQIINTVTLAYDGGSVSETDPVSEATYGPASASVSTTLNDPLDAAAQATRFLGLWAYPMPQFDTLSLALHKPGLPDADIDTALAVYNGQPVQVIGLPTAIGATFSGFVEGWTWRLGRTTADLKLTVSDFARSVVTTQWQYATPSLTWATTNATLEWQEAIVI